MELSPSLVGAGHSAAQEFPNILWNEKVDYRVLRPSLGLPSGLFPFAFPTNIL
jgi:hypothetical protein